MNIKKPFLLNILIGCMLTNFAFAGKYGWSPCFKNEIEFPSSAYNLKIGMTHLEIKDGYHGKMISPHLERCDIGFNNDGYQIEDLVIWDMGTFNRYEIPSIPSECKVVQKKETLTFWGTYDPESHTVKNLRCTLSE